MSQGGFFEFREKLARAGRAKPDPQPGSSGQPMTVSELTARIDSALRAGVPGSVQVRGEVSNFNHHRASGHFYFTLKDSSACIDCVMFRAEAARLAFTPEDGMELLATGGVRVYAQRGRYQLYVTSLAPLGRGALELTLQKLREKLSREGLFERERKKPIPRYPLRIALVTSQQTAALQDMLKVLSRFAFLQLRLFHVPVQGAGAAEKIAECLQSLGKRAPSQRPDVILLGRGGGSLEDLWAFNEEVVARAMAGCPIPIVTGIGHEIDVSIADLVADYHAHTPTEAAQVIVAHWRTAGEAVDLHAIRLARALRQIVASQRQRLRELVRHEVFRRPGDIVNLRRQRLDDLARTMADGLAARTSTARARVQQIEARLVRVHPGHRLALIRQRVEQLALALRHAALHLRRHQADKLAAIETHLRAIAPAATLGRGYSITTRKSDGAIIRAAADVKPGDVIQSRFADGQVESVVRDQKQMRLWE